MAMIIVTLVVTLAGAMVWQQWRAVQVEAAERARTQSAWILTGALDWARLILREDARTGRRRPPRRAVGGAAGRGAPVDLPGRRQGQHRRRARRLPVRRHHRRAGALQPAQPDRRTARCVPDELAALERLCPAAGVATDVATRIAEGLRDASALAAAPATNANATPAAAAALCPARPGWASSPDSAAPTGALRHAAAGAHAGERSTPPAREVLVAAHRGPGPGQRRTAGAGASAQPFKTSGRSRPGAGSARRAATRRSR